MTRELLNTLDRMEARMVRIETRTARALHVLGVETSDPPKGYLVRENSRARSTGPWEVYRDGQRLTGCWSRVEACAWAVRHDIARRPA